MWGNHNECEHEWGFDLPAISMTHQDRLGNAVDPRTGRPAGGKVHGQVGGFSVAQGNFCLKCNAWKGELGLEPTISLFIDHLVQIFDEVRRVLKKTGSLWVVIDDSYNANYRGSGPGNATTKQLSNTGTVGFMGTRSTSGTPAKSLCLVPYRFAAAMVDAGWILRNDVVWEKNNPMPESTRDRFTGSWEHIFFFVKSNTAQFWTNTRTRRVVAKQPPGTQGIEGEDWEWVEHSACQGKGCGNKRCVDGKIKSSLWSGHDYYFERQFEPMAYPERTYNPDVSNHATAQLRADGNRTTGGLHDGRTQYGNPELGRNKRDVWRIPTKPYRWPPSYKGSHFAVYPAALCCTPILAGCPEALCAKCGLPRVKVYEKGFTAHTGQTESTYDRKTTAGRLALLRQAARERGGEYRNDAEMVGYATCDCGADFAPGVALDPFAGSGTTGSVAKEHGRRYVGVELNPDYCGLHVHRLKQTKLAPTPVEGTQ